MNKTSYRQLSPIFAALTAFTTLAIWPTVSHAKAGDVINTGACSALGKWKLKLSPENGQIEAEADLDNLRPGSRYRVQLSQNGAIFYNALQTANAVGNIEIRSLRPNRPGADTVRLVAVAASAPANSCNGSATATF
jgi:hypothetical protein